MATKKHMNYDSDEAMTLRGSKIPKAIMASEGTRFDSAEDASVFFARELDHVKAQSYDVEYPELTALHLFPQSFRLLVHIKAVWRIIRQAMNHHQNPHSATSF